MITSRKFIIGEFLLSLMALLCSCGGGAAGVVTFPDPNLEAAIREAIEKPTSVSTNLTFKSLPL